MTQQSKIPANRINVEELQKSLGGGLELGDIGIAPLGIDETKNLRRYLNGQVISQTQFEAFTNLIKKRILTHPSIATTEENWQSEVNLSKLGQCGKFVVDDIVGTIRLPKVVNINGLQDLALLGSIKAESLPNITGNTESHYRYDTGVASGAFKTESGGGGVSIGSAASTGCSVSFFDASLSSSTYQDNAPVQQEAVQYPYFIQVATGNEEQADITTEIQLNNPFSLLDYKWSEYELTNASWLISNGSFHSGATYLAVYELLLKIYNGTEIKQGVSVKLSTETYEDTDFVLNTTESTFRLPIKVKLASGNRVAGNGMVLGATDGTTLGGLNNTTGTANNYIFMKEQYGVSVGTVASSATALSATDRKALGITTDPTKSGIETSSSDLKLYFYVGETVQDANIIATSQVLTKVANCLDRESAADRQTVVSWGIPDYTSVINITSPYTVPTDGMIELFQRGVQTYDGSISVIINGVSMPAPFAYITSTVNKQYYVSKGDVVVFSYGGGNSSTRSSKFYPLKGVNND